MLWILKRAHKVKWCMVLQVNSTFSSVAFLLTHTVTYMPSACCGWLTRYKTWSRGSGSSWRECLPLNLCGLLLPLPVKAPGQDDGACSGWSSGHCILWGWLQDCQRRSTLITFYPPPFLSTFLFWAALPFCCVHSLPPPVWLPWLFFQGFLSHYFTVSSRLPCCIWDTHRDTHLLSMSDRLSRVVKSYAA